MPPAASSSDRNGSSSQDPARTVRVLPDADAMSQAAARFVVDCVARVLGEQDHARIALAGGSTPRGLHERLATEHAGAMAWDRIDVFWGDERFVPHDHPKSNTRMARETLLRHVPIPNARVHTIPTDADTPDVAARTYEARLRDAFGGGDTTFDLTLLGMGSDGHTASLFPGADETPPTAEEPWVAAVEAPPSHDIRQRITCTVPVLNRSRHVAFLVAGARKHNAVRAILDEGDRSLPAARIRAQETLTWFLDEAARSETAG